ncbi:MAG: ABC transporter permease subunit [Clostridiales bacterium]|nr:ABC transporter permease subunit [Clostridiales bacterium]
MSSQIYKEYLSETGGNAYMASALSIVLVVCALLVLMLQKIYISRKNYMMTSMRPPTEESLHGWRRAALSFPIYVIILISMLPQITVMVCSFLPWDFTRFVKGFTFDNYIIIFNRLGTNIKNTFVFSGIAIVIIILMGLVISYIIAKKKGISGSVIDFLIMFPYVIPGSVLGICLIVAFNKQPLILTGTAAIIIISFVVRKLPFTVRSGAAYLYQLDSSVEEASVSLGVSPMKTFFSVTARLMLPGMLSGAILSWIACINELSSSIMLYSGTTSTIAVTIYTETFRNAHNTAAALATILTLTTAAALAIFLKLSKGKVAVV